MHGLRHPVLPSGLPAGQPDSGLERSGLPRFVARGARAAAPDQQLPGVHRPAVPGAVRRVVRARHQQGPGHHQVDRAGDHRPRLRRGLGRAGGANDADVEEGGGDRIGARRAGRIGPAQSRRPQRHGVRKGRSHRRPAALRHPRVQAGEARPRSTARTAGGRGRGLPPRRGCRERHLRGRSAPRLRRRGPGRRRRPPARPRGAGARSAGRAFRDGVPHAAEPPLPGRRRSRSRRDQRRGQARHHHRRRRHRRGLPRHRASSGCGIRDAARAAARATQRACLRQPVAPVAHRLPHIVGARGGR